MMLSPPSPPFDYRQHDHLPEDQRVLLLGVARNNSEQFARRLMKAAMALDACEDGIECAAAGAGIEFVESLNGVDVYEEITRTSSTSDASNSSTRLRGICHIDADIREVVRRLTAPSSASTTLVPGIVDTYELCSVLPFGSQQRSPHDGEDEHVTDVQCQEHAGINWFLLNHESTRESLVPSSMVNAGLDPRVRPIRMDSSSTADESQDLAFDFVVLSYQGVFRHRNLRGWVQWCQSVDLPQFASPSDDWRRRRGGLFASGIVAVESVTRPGQVSVSYAMGVALRGLEAPERRLLETAAWKRVMKLGGLKRALERQSLARTISLLSSPPSPMSQRPQRHESSASAFATAPRSSKSIKCETSEFVVEEESLPPSRQPECEPTKDSSEETRNVHAVKAREHQCTSAIATREKRATTTTTTARGAGFFALFRRTEKAKSLEKMVVPSSGRRRAQTMQTRSSSRSPVATNSSPPPIQTPPGLPQAKKSLNRTPSALEFRLTYYQDPDAVVGSPQWDASPPSPPSPLAMTMAADDKEEEVSVMPPSRPLHRGPKSSP